MIKYLSLIIIFIFAGYFVYPQNTQSWPKSINDNGSLIKVYQPLIEKYNGDAFDARGAFSILEKGKSDPVFGALWMNAIIHTDRVKRIAVIEKIKVIDIKFAGDSNISEVTRLTTLLEKEIPTWNLEISLDQLEASIEAGDSAGINTSENLSTTPPKIIYSNKPSTLVLIDGDPKLKENKEMGVEMVMNTAFTIVRLKDLYYLNGSDKWYTAKDINGPWKYTKSIPSSLDKLDKAIKENDKKEMSKAAEDSAANSIPEIIVSMEPAELIQSNGDADFSPIKETGLLYMTNTNNDVFMNISDQLYYVLLSGRWYASASLKGPWTYTASDKLPADFSKIPVGSPKDDVLASVTGTDQAQDAIMDAQIPQTKKVDRKTATATVNYDGDPKFLAIDGTSIQYAINTSSTVLLSGNKYYCVENGVWFEAITPKGPWTVSTSRPSEVDKIPATVPVYNVKYVYVYETTPQYVYVGYTPGYTGCYVYGGTVFYGTGYYYNPWYGPYYYPRPVTYGFSMRYNPYYGWSVGFHYSAGWFNYSVYRRGYYGGYWGPPMYRPPYYHHPGYPPHYHPPYYPKPGYRPPVARPLPATRPVPSTRPSTGNPNGRPSTLPANGSQNGRPSTMPANGNPNGRPSTMPATGNPNGRPSTMPATGNPNTRPSTQPSRPGTGVITDSKGNVYQRDGNNWQQRNGSQWQNLNQNRPVDINNLNRQQQTIDRGNTRTNNFNQSREAAPAQRSSQQRPAPAARSRR